MQDEIVRKLNEHIATGIAREADVVYLLAEVRKLSEHGRAMKRYPVLAFYSNWVLHTRIDRGHWVASSLKAIDAAIAETRKGGDPGDVPKAIDAALSFDQLRREILDFGAEYGVFFNSMSIRDWRSFMELLVSVLVDCPLQTKSVLDCVAELSLSRKYTLNFDGRESIAFWRVVLTDGTEVVNAIF